MSIYNDRVVAAAKRFALTCSCVGNTVPCAKCWPHLEAKYRLYSETGKKLES